MLKAAVLFYLMPIAALNQYLADHIDFVRKVFQDNSKVVFLGENTGVLYHTPNGPVWSSGNRKQILIAAVWGIVVLGILVFEVIRNLRWAKSLRRLTALAFGTVQEVYVPWEEDDSSHWEQGEFVFVEDGAAAQDFEEAGFEDWDMPECDFLYDFEFVDKSGNIYSVEEQDVVVHAICQHQYVSGTYKEHVKDANGGCTITQYEASRCSLCGNIVLGDILASSYQKVCLTEL